MDSGLLSFAAANNFLSIFRAVMIPHFPFVVIPSHVTAEVLRKEKPFLFLTVMTVASFDNLPLQRALGEEVKKVISERIIVSGEVSFEMLQGLLVYLAW